MSAAACCVDGSLVASSSFTPARARRTRSTRCCSAGSRASRRARICSVSRAVNGSPDQRGSRGSGLVAQRRAVRLPPRILAAWKIIRPDPFFVWYRFGAKEKVVRKLSVVIAATALALAGVGCGSQAHQSSTTTTTTVRAAPARAVAVVVAHQSSTTTTTTVGAAPAGPVAVAGRVNAPPATSIVGTWSGYLTPPPGTHASRQRFMVVIDPRERRGTWRASSTCAGTLRLKDISSGYHHYYRVAGAHPGCAAPGIDCLKRSGAQMVDVFVPNARGRDIDGTFRRVS